MNTKLLLLVFACLLVLSNGCLAEGLDILDVEEPLFVDVDTAQDSSSVSETPTIGANLHANRGADDLQVSTAEYLDLVNLAELDEEELGDVLERCLPEASIEERAQFAAQLRQLADCEPLKAQALFELSTNEGTVRSEYADMVDYLHRSGRQVLLGSYSDDATLLGTAGEVGLSFTGLDLPADLRDLSHDVLNPELSLSWAGKTTLDGIGLFPVVGSLKHADEVGELIRGVGKHGDEILDASGTTARRLGNATAEVAGELNDVKAASKGFWQEIAEFEGKKIYRRDDLYDLARKDNKGRTNMQRMRKGMAPIGHDGEVVNIHHMLQSDGGPLIVISGSMHQTYSKILHVNPNSIPSGIDRRAFATFRRHFWKNEARKIIE